ncbi:hypothetical protein DPMN_045938 [Dreissena polymorpha]|uniref:Uncharacterized protein n=1 Tax=Dreissena polymorpha TaxID=45954 RepID=A0A9D4D595_DREPO|nr:hypothetical protein DPMN_045938 [Dreissena polymorpha]
MQKQLKHNLKHETQTIITLELFVTYPSGQYEFGAQHSAGTPTSTWFQPNNVRSRPSVSVCGSPSSFVRVSPPIRPCSVGRPSNMTQE